MKAFFKASCAALLLFTAIGSSYADEAQYMDKLLNQAKIQSTGRLTYWGLPIYDATLYRSAAPNASEFALEIRYQRSISGDILANRTADEMVKTGIPERQAEVWGKELAKIFPNVEPGTMLTAVYVPKQGTTFLLNQKPLAQVPGEDFSKAFFGVWFSDKTSSPKLRKTLLGQNCLSPLFSEPCTP
ncbi:chalcone isomerase family protein [Polynucleobacter paludilacus]|uniref:chalcone isomerase family protein n=1 Tax=Polynucleobacter paludilacus TaxID=1855895 RepID=UPI001BFDDECF|nr:chalcone isomerase family protein [Polynucleobacter paludilacus]QWD86666.1 chalcone isomerase family protein [Polynucleobacter paludilacus]